MYTRTGNRVERVDHNARTRFSMHMHFFYWIVLHDAFQATNAFVTMMLLCCNHEFFWGAFFAFLVNFTLFQCIFLDFLPISRIATEKFDFNELNIVLRNVNHFHFELYNVWQSGFKLD